MKFIVFRKDYSRKWWNVFNKHVHCKKCGETIYSLNRKTTDYNVDINYKLRLCNKCNKKEVKI